MKELKSFLKKLKAYDLVVISFYIFLTSLHLIFFDRILNSSMWIVTNAGIISLTLLLAFFEDRYANIFWRILHYWYIAPLILLTFKELYFMIKPIRGMDYDFLFIEADRFLFGGDPTKFFYQIANPFLTEILQIVYGSFYLLPIILCLSLLRKKRYVATDFALFSVVYGFFLSYLGYFSLPGIGPRFTLHDFGSVNEMLPGLFLTNFLREIVNTGESIPAGTIDPAGIVQRDVFPSGHTMITLIVMYLSIKLRSRSRYFFIPVGSLLIFSTVYLWYHYVIDLIAGALFMMFAMWSGKYIFNWWKRKTHEAEFNYLDH